ncbi:hypothetical protein V1478_011595 [Vespula squamosa]|uniref:Uncharacterized protein n=1 Tax=Vespula squamosa TaxID=30214 RepID=A0ABD2AEY1_VESSQ
MFLRGRKNVEHLGTSKGSTKQASKQATASKQQQAIVAFYVARALRIYRMLTVKRLLQQSGQNDLTFVEQGLNEYPDIRLGYSRFVYTKIRAMRALVYVYT